MFLRTATLTLAALVCGAVHAQGVLRVSDVRMENEELPFVREFEPLRYSQELEAHAEEPGPVCSTGISRWRALNLFDKMARPDGKRGIDHTHADPEPLERKPGLLNSMHARALGCLD